MHDKERRKRAQENSKTLQHIVETTVFLGAQRLPFQGHRENDPSKNPGNICLPQLDQKIKPVLGEAPRKEKAERIENNDLLENSRRTHQADR